MLHETRHTLPFGIYYCVEVVIMGFYGFLCFFALSRIKLLKLALYCMKLCTQHYLVYIIVLKWLQLKIIVICFKLRAHLQFYGFLSFLGNFAHKVAQTWIVLYEIWHSILFGVYYCVEVVIILNHRYILNITW